jgi:hypothetical protein
MQKAQSVHHIPGRLRLKLSGAKGNHHLLDTIRESIQAIPDVTGVEVNPRTGSVLVLYRSREPATFLRDLRERGLNQGFLHIDAFPIPKRSVVRAVITAPLALVRRRRDSSNVGSASPSVSTRLRKFTGHALIALGVVGVLLPIVPGTPFLLAGAAVLGKKDPLVARCSGWIRNLRAALRAKPDVAR